MKYKVGTVGAVAVAVTAIIWHGVQEVPPATVLWTLIICLTTAWVLIVTGDDAIDTTVRIPNGLPRPEDELPRKKVFLVSERVGNILYLASGTDGALIFWSFENLQKEVEPGKRIVYLDNLETEFLAIWKEKGVIPILSAQGRAKIETKKDEHTEARNRFSEAMS